jgi:hypothetical protein
MLRNCQLQPHWQVWSLGEAVAPTEHLGQYAGDPMALPTSWIVDPISEPDAQAVD